VPICRRSARKSGSLLKAPKSKAVSFSPASKVGVRKISDNWSTCAGFPHAPKAGRLSLSYDVLELHRADLTRGVFNYVLRRKFGVQDIEQDARDVVRLGPAVAKEIAAMALRAAPMADCVKTVRKIAGWL
jgi:hypothetical protein